MDFVNWDSIPKTVVREGVTRRIFSGRNVMLSLVEAKPGMKPNPHKHPQEQVIFLLKGKMELQVGDKKGIMEVGEVCLVPPNVQHSSTVLSEEGVLILDTFSPIREDFL